MEVTRAVRTQWGCRYGASHVRDRQGAGPGGSALPPPLAGEGRGEGISTAGQSPRGKSPHPPHSASASASPASGRGGSQPREAGQIQNDPEGGHPVRVAGGLGRV
ncbi:hypothetical protein EAS54_00805 [Bradyrhizobium guangzhouense]|nr:hypothetical protein EAS54_00805 [Bradyrhizobium guangzhouense]